MLSTALTPSAARLAICPTTRAPLLGLLDLMTANTGRGGEGGPGWDRESKGLCMGGGGSPKLSLQRPEGRFCSEVPELGRVETVRTLLSPAPSGGCPGWFQTAAQPGLAVLRVDGWVTGWSCPTRRLRLGPDTSAISVTGLQLVLTQQTRCGSHSPGRRVGKHRKAAQRARGVTSLPTRRRLCQMQEAPSPDSVAGRGGSWARPPEGSGLA